MEGIPRGGDVEVEEEEEGGSSEDSMDAVTLHIQVQDSLLFLRDICCLDWLVNILWRLRLDS